MAEQAVDLRSAFAVWSRHRVLLAVAALLGAGAGAGLVQVVAPHYASTSQVLLPVVSTSAQDTSSRDRDTEMEIASSDVVTGPAGKAVTPHLTSSQVAHRMKVDAPSSDVIAFRVDAASPKEAEDLAQALADAEVAYSNGAAGSLVQARSAALLERKETLQKSLDSVSAEITRTTERKAGEAATSTAGRADAAALAELTAQQADLALQLDSVKSQLMDGEGTQTASVIQHATPATTRSAAMRYALYGIGGLVAAVLLTGLVLTVAARRDRRLRSRDEIADALGCSVVASVRSRRPGSVSAWQRLLSSYSPDTVDAWALRQVLHRVRPGTGQGASEASVIVIALSDDAGGLGMGPQLASYAASTGVVTRFLAHGSDESAAALWAAARRDDGGEALRDGLLVDAENGDAELAVALVVLDRRRPSADDLVHAREAVGAGEHTTTLVAVAAGSATAEELARAAVLVDDQGSRIDGVVVADPDDLDRTTGRMSITPRTPSQPRLAAVPISRPEAARRNGRNG